jgi:hypothetical protein
VNGPAASGQSLHPDSSAILLTSDTRVGSAGSNANGAKGSSENEGLPTAVAANDAFFAQGTEPLAAVENGDAPVLPTTFAPQGLGLLGTGLAIDLPAVEQSVARFFDKLDHLGHQLAAVPEKAGLPAWLPALAAAGVALEITRRQLRSAQRHENEAGDGPDGSLTWNLGVSH